MRTVSLLLFILTFYFDHAVAESGSISYQSSVSLTNAMRTRESLCQQLKHNPNCPARDTILQQVTGLSVVGCQAKTSSNKCTQFFRAYPEYQSKAMSCNPYEICRLGLESTLLRGCGNYGIQVKDSFLAALQGEITCAQNWRCILNQELSLATALIAPGTYMAIHGQQMTSDLIETFKTDKDKIKNLECLNPETQTQFMCYLAVQYGGALLGGAGAARAIGAKMLGEMAQLEVKLGIKSRIQLSLAARRLEGNLARLTKAKVLLRDGGYVGRVIDKPISPGRYILVQTKSVTKTGRIRERLTLIESAEGIGPSTTVRRIRADNEEYIPGHRTSVGNITIGADGRVSLSAAENMSRAGDLEILTQQLRSIGIRP